MADMDTEMVIRYMKRIADQMCEKLDGMADRIADAVADKIAWMVLRAYEKTQEDDRK